MELKFAIDKGRGQSSSSSNRTFMELKYEWDEAKKEVLIVLIVPLWN